MVFFFLGLNRQRNPPETEFEENNCNIIYLMLGAMIQEVFYDSMIKILFFIHYFISALVIKIIVDEEENDKNVFVKIVTHPFKLGFLFATLFLVELSSPIFIIEQAQSFANEVVSFITSIRIHFYNRDD